MALQPVTMWKLGCDFPHCTATAQDGGDYAAWGEKFAAIQEAEDAGWVFGPDIEDRQYYCDGHKTIWASEFERRSAGELERDLRDCTWPVLLLNDISRLSDGEAYLCELREQLVDTLRRLEKAS